MWETHQFYASLVVVDLDFQVGSKDGGWDGWVGVARSARLDGGHGGPVELSGSSLSACPCRRLTFESARRASVWLLELLLPCQDLIPFLLEAAEQRANDILAPRGRTSGVNMGWMFGVVVWPKPTD